MTVLAAFFTRRDAPSSVFRCGCCGDVLDREDHMGEAFTDAHTEAVIVLYGREVCFGCADELGKEWV